MNCTNCNYLNLPQAVFCGDCGMKFNISNEKLEHNNSSFDTQISISSNYNQLVQMKLMNKLPRTVPLRLVQIINYLIIFLILFIAIILIAWFFGEEEMIFIILITILLLLIMRYFVKGLNRYNNQTKNIFLILPLIEVLFILFFIIVDFEIFLIPYLIFPGLLIYALVYHKPTSDYFKIAV